MIAGRLDRRVQFTRATLADDGLASSEVWADYGEAVWASKQDLRDSEKWRAGEVAASVTTRFQVRWNSITETVTPKDRLTCDGREYDIVGVKEIGRREGIELTCAARADA